MIKKRVILTLLILLVLEIVSPFVFKENNYVQAATPSHLGNKDASFNHFEDTPNGWARYSNGNFMQIGGYFIRDDVNQLRANWHAVLGPDVELATNGGIGLDSPTAYTPPAGYKIHSIASYAVYQMRTYLVQKEESGCQGGLPSDNKCNPYYFIGDAGEDNAWAKTPNISSASHWVNYKPDIMRFNPGRNKTMLYYQWRTAQIRKTGDTNGANGTPWLKYDFKIVKDKPTTPPVTDPCVTNPSDPSCTPGTPGPPTDPGPPNVSPPPIEACARDINVGGSGSINGSNMLADPNGKIIESPESGQFDVLKYGIPSSEHLKVEGQSEKYLSDYSYQGMGGSVTYRVKVTKDYMLRWLDKAANTYVYEHVRQEEVVPDVYSVSYWQIGHLAVYSFMDATFRNYALPNEMVVVPNTQQATASSNHSASVGSHVFPKNCESIYLGLDTIDGGETKPSAPMANLSGSAQQGSRPPDVKNDYVNVDGVTYMNDGMVSLNGPTPSGIPPAPQVRVEKFSLLIEPTKVNKWQTPSSITSRYQTIHTVNTGGGSREFTGTSPTKINPVTVHTPVVMYSKASDDKEHDQRTDAPNRSTPANSDTDRHAFILDRPFTVTLPTNGQHLDVGMAPGYGNRDYAKYTKTDGKQVKFPFDVYTADKSAFYPKETWIRVPLNQTDVTFFMPVWVPEGEYTVKFRSIAINAPAELPEEHHANLNLTYRTPNGVMANHVAYDTIEVDVVGRLYDFRVTDILDFNWENVFRTTKGLIEPTGNQYWVGDKMIDGQPRTTFTEPFRLPIRHGSHPDGYRNVAVKTGYQFKFDMKTKGDMREQNDGVHITPSFYFVDKNGQNRRKVDVYYHNDAKYFVKVGSPQDKEYRMVKLNEPLRNVPKSQLNNTADYYYRHANNYGYTTEKNTQFIHTFIRNFERDYSKQANATGPYGDQILHWKLRTFMGPLANNVPANAMVPQADAISSEQTWYGEYSLPADIYIVEEGKNIAGYGQTHRLNKSHPLFLRDGYLIVNFDIETIQKGDLSKPHLQYINGELSNQWKREGFKYSFTDPYGFNFPLIDGDVIFYHGDQSSLDDFVPSVTH